MWPMSSDRSPRARLLRRPEIGPGPLRDLKEAIYDLYLGAGAVTLDQIRARIDDLADGDTASDPTATPKRDTIHDVICGDTLPQNVNHVIAVAAGLLYHHLGNGQLVRGNPEIERVRSLWARAARHRPPGRPIADWLPVELGVHRAVVGDRELPEYVVRGHDELLRTAVGTVARSGRSGVVMLVGTSSSGKTRACYEALHWPLDTADSLATAGWRLWPAVHPVDPRQFLDELPHVGPRTVVWLDEAQRYLLEPGIEVRERIASGLRELVLDRARGPVLVLGTLWPRYWYKLMRDPQSDEPGPVAARLLLDGNGIRIADTFSEKDLSVAGASTDQRLSEAARQAEGAAVTQYLAGAPDLLQRYEMAEPATRVVIDTAMDARRLGHGELLSTALLRAAAPAYLDARTRRVMERDPEWFDVALAQLTSLGRGETSVLAPESGGERVRLADYLDQHSRRTRLFLCPPQGFWDAVADTVTDPDDLVRLADNARSRLRFRIAVALYRRAGTDAALYGLVAIADCLDEAGCSGDAEQLVRATARGELKLTATRRNRGRGDRDRDEAVLRRAVEGGDLDAFPLLATLLESTGDSTGAEQMALRALELGDGRAVSELVVLRDLDEPGAGQRLLDRLPARLRSTAHDDLARVGIFVETTSSEQDDPPWVRAQRLLEAGDHDAADRVMRETTLSWPVDLFVLLMLQNALYEAGETAKALEWADTIFDGYGAVGFGGLLSTRAAAGDLAGAEEVAMRAAARRATQYLWIMAMTLNEQGDVAGAERCARQAIFHGDTMGTVALAVLREQQGDHRGAAELALTAAIAGENQGLVALAESRLDSRDTDNAWLFARQAVDMAAPEAGSGRHSWPPLIELHQPHNLLATGLAADGSVETVPPSDW